MELIERYIATWNETDADARRKLIDETWTDTATYVDPLVVAEGKDVIDQVIAGVAAFVKKNEPILRVTDTAAAEGDKRFQKVRATVLANVASGLAVQGAKTKEVAGNADVLAAMLLANPSDPAAARRLVHQGITGRKPTA